MKRSSLLDLLRLVAAYLVLFGHFSSSGTFDNNNAGAVRWYSSAGEPLPLLRTDLQGLWKVDKYLNESFAAPTAIIGVALFFLISGWLIPTMLLRYSRKAFIVNSFFRIFPMLVFSVLLGAAMQYQFGDRNSLNPSAVLSTLALTNHFTGHPFSLPVVWTLIIEFQFYILLALIGPVNIRKILCILGGILLISTCFIGYSASAVHSGDLQRVQEVKRWVHDFHYIIFMLFGSCLWLAMEGTQRSTIRKWCVLLLLVILLGFNLNRYLLQHHGNVVLHQDIHPINQIIVCAIFTAVVVLDRLIARNVKILRYIVAASNITYSLYLVHIIIGFYLLSTLRHTIYDQNLLVLVVTALVTAFSVITYRYIETPGNAIFKKLHSRGFR
jgi:peptidoglycan/LPS O-acetylase OafA/YrhL